MSEPTKLTTKELPDGLKVLSFHGDLDSMGVRMIDESFSSAISDVTSRVLVDLDKVNFISSAGIAMLIVRGKTLRRGGGELYIAGASDRVYEVLSLAGLQDLFSIYPTVDAALAALSKG